MKFGPVSVDEAAGAILAHTLHFRGGVLKKGHVLETDDLARVAEAGIAEVTVARLEEGDIDENGAAAAIAKACTGAGLTPVPTRTGRVNLKAECAGLVLIDEERIHRMNAVDEALTIATVRPFEPLAVGQVAATVKIITFGVAGEQVEACAAIARDGGSPVRLAPFRPCRVGFIQTLLPGLKDSVLDKATSAMTARLEEMGLSIAIERHCPHDPAAVAEALSALAESGCDIALVLGASAIVDRRDVIPEAIERCGGTLEHLGLPVDPGNLTLLARLAEMRILGVPGSARSPRPHGFDWILQRLVAGLDVAPADLTRMGVGGLLKEIPSRPMPRERIDRRAGPARVAGIILAAGQSRRMGTVNKLLAEIGGEPMIRHVARAMTGSRAAPIVVVLGHQPDLVAQELDDFDVLLVRNPEYVAGLSTSLRAGLGALPADIDGAVIALGDMPGVSSGDIDALIAAFAPDDGRAICVPTFKGKRGNPVLWARRYFVEMTGVSGDVGARHLIGEHADEVHEVAIGHGGVLLDLDTPAALDAHRKGGSAAGE